VLSSDAAVVARVRPPAAAPANIVLADPPYDVSISVMRALVADLVAAGWLAADAHVVIERPARENESPFPDDWENQSRRMGDTVLWYGRAVGEDVSTSELSAEGS
jgi:16S rRNA (guanine966-N2)-methyltransferase